MDHSLGIKRPIASFQSVTHLAKRTRFLENGIKSMDMKVEAHANQVDKVNATAHATDLDTMEADSERIEAVIPNRKTNDSPAVVPIKKRRIPIVEATRTPSPPPILPDFGPQELSPSHGEICPTLLSNTSCSSVSSVSSPRSTPPIFGVPLMSQACPPDVLEMQSLACQADLPKVVECSEHCSDSNLDPRKALGKVEECFNDDNDISAQTGFVEGADGQGAQNTGSDQVCCQAKSDEQLIMSESGSFSRDDRLHWDLNTDMAAWDDSTEQGLSKMSKEKRSSVTPSGSPSVESAGIDREEGNEDASKQPEDDLECEEAEPGNDGVCIAGRDTADNCEFAEEKLPTIEVISEELEVAEEDVNDHHIGDHVEEGAEIGYSMDDEPNIVNQDFSGNSDHRNNEKEETPSPSPSMHTDCGWQAPDDPVNYADAGREGSWDAELSPDGKDRHDKPEILGSQDGTSERHKLGKQGKLVMDDRDAWNDEPELEEDVDYGDSDCKDADDPGLDVDDRTSLVQVESRWRGDDELKLPFCEGEGLATGEGFHSSLSETGENPDNRVSSSRSRITGWDKLPEGFDSAEDALRAAKEEATRRSGRGSLWSSGAGRGSLHATNRLGPSSIRGHNRDGFSSARGDNFYVERHPDEPMHERDGFRHGRRADDNFSVRARDPSRRPGVFGRGRASGWVDSQPGHINQWGSGRNRSGSGYSGPSSAIAVPRARPDKSGFVVSSDASLTKSGMGPGRGGLRSAVSGGRLGRGAHIRGPPVDMDGGAHYPLRGGAIGGTGMGLAFSGSMHDRNGRVTMDTYRGGGMDSRRSLSPRRPHMLDPPGMMGRVPGFRPDSRVVRSRTPPPMHRSMGSSDFSSVRNQRSPLASRWSNEEREPDSYQDRDFKRPMSRARLPSQRTSPHVVHGSSLTDERDRQVLARHSPPSKSSLGPAHLRKPKDDSVDSRALKRMEEDGRYIGSYGKEGDYRRCSPPRETDRERGKGGLYRRDRERDDERRRDFCRSSSRDGRVTSGLRHSSIREGDDDVAPRRRRLS